MNDYNTPELPNANAKEIQEFWKDAEIKYGRTFLCTPDFTLLYPPHESPPPNKYKKTRQ